MGKLVFGLRYTGTHCVAAIHHLKVAELVGWGSRRFARMEEGMNGKSK
jgi:hypothetical protein